MMNTLRTALIYRIGAYQACCSEASGEAYAAYRARRISKRSRELRVGFLRAQISLAAAAIKWLTPSPDGSDT